MMEFQEWENHIRQGHCPFRRDCAICVESRGRDRQHFRQHQVESFCLALDVSGPYKEGIDQVIVKPRYYITGVVTVPCSGENPLVSGLRELEMKVDHQLENVESPLPGSTSSAQQGPYLGALIANSGRGENTDGDPLMPEEESEDSPLTEAEVKEFDLLEQQWRQTFESKEKIEVKNLSQSVPLKSRKPRDVIEAVTWMMTKLRTLGFPVHRVHTDRAREFLSAEFKNFIKKKEVVQSCTSGDEARSNGRVESELGVVRGLARTMMRASAAEEEMWPLAIRTASEVRFRQQLQALGVPTQPVLPFGVKALAKRKLWNRQSQWQHPNTPVRLWGPACDMSMLSNAYFAQLETGKFVRTTAVIVPRVISPNEEVTVMHVNPPRPLNEIPTEEVDGQTFDGLPPPDPEDPMSGFVEDENASPDSETGEPMAILGDAEVVTEVAVTLEEPPTTTNPPTRRLHGKHKVIPQFSEVPALLRKAANAGGECPMEEVVAAQEGVENLEIWLLFQHQQLQQVLQQCAAEMMDGDVEKIQTEVAKKAKREINATEAKLRTLMTAKDEAQEEVLQTRTVSVQEVRKDMDSWKQPFEEEYQTLCSTVIKPLTPSMLRQAMSSATHVERIPSKIVPTIKPPHKKRGRIVACGNYSSVPEGEVSAGGVETICLRTLLRKSAQLQWQIATIDVKKAFLNAPRTEKHGCITIIDPPSVLVSMGVVPSSEAWLVTGAIYGLTQSPHDWGMHRDGMFRQFRWDCQGETLKLIETPERHLWRIISESTQEEKGYLCSYVDDLLVTGEKAVVDSTIQKIESTWSCSEPDYINDSKNVRFCGYELRWDKEGNLLLMQPSYVLDLLQKYDVKGQEAEPCPKIIFEEKEEYLAETLREAQQITGELLWAQTRTRPDLSYVVGAMSRWLHKRPHYVIQLGHHALRYLANTPCFGLCYGVCDGESWNVEEGLQTPPSIDNVEVFVDSSFSLEHEQYRSVTGVLLMQGNAPISWTSNRQPFIATTTAEAEIIGYSESQQQADGLDQLLQVFGSNPMFNLYGDSRSALSLSTGEGGPWRTRHLRLRAAKLREILRMSREGRDGRQNPKWTARHLPGVKLVADGLTKALHGQSFKSFRSRLHMVDTAIKEENKPVMDKITTNEVDRSSETWWSKLVLVGTLLVSMSKNWMIALGALLLSIVKKFKKTEDDQPRLCAFRAHGDPSRDQAPLPPPRNLARESARDQARSLGTAHRELYRNFEIPQAVHERERFWWESERFDVWPVGPDKWIQPQEGLLVRTHSKARRRSFHPLHRSVPVDVASLRPVRYTVIFPDDDGSQFVDPRPRFVEKDEWSGNTQWSKDFRWRGYTVFVLKSCNLEDGGTSMPAYVDPVLRAPRRVNSRVFGGDQIHHENHPSPGSDLPGEQEHQPSSEAASSSGYGSRNNLGGTPIVNVTVNVTNNPLNVSGGGIDPASPQDGSNPDSEFEFVTP